MGPRLSQLIDDPHQSKNNRQLLVTLSLPSSSS